MKEKNGEALSIICDHFHSLQCIVPDNMKDSIQNSCRIINDVLESEGERRKELDVVWQYLTAIEKSEDAVVSECARMARLNLEDFFKEEFKSSGEEA